jgi:DNA-binding SARP family transcriptional activator/Tfp pilus assembly protein PilF
MEFRVLGPLEVHAAGRVLDLGSGRQRRILAALLLQPNRVVTLSRLVEVAWDDDPPATARRQMQNRVAALRATLTREGGFIDTLGSGYLLRVGPGELDALVFADLAERGRATGDPRLLREALALWRGPALAGLTGAVLAGEAATLEEHRLAAWEECVDLELAAGGHARVVADLRELTAAHPLRERLVGQLMVALHRCGRRDEALAAYRALAARLADELGIDPGVQVRRLYEGVLTGDAGTVRPSQLPADVSGFTGRGADLARLDRLLAAGPAAGPTTAVLTGTAGVGKTALAVHWAHHVRHRFPDGQLYVNLRGYAQTPPPHPIDALAGFLRALGVPTERVPTEADEAAVMYRQLLAGKRVLVVLDNAAGARQVRPLLPSSRYTMTLVTSRDTLTDLREGNRLSLDVLSPAEAVALLTRVLGAERTAAEPDATAQLAKLCAYLPLALRIAAANLADGDACITEYTARLGAGNRLAALEVAGDEQAAVRAAFDLSYAALPTPARRMFRLLGLAPGPDTSVDAAAALAGTGPGEARQLLDRLVAAHLIDATAGRFGFHDLLKAYAAELAGAAPEPDATRRLLDHYLHTARAAAMLVDPHRDPFDLPPPSPGANPIGPVDAAGALAWFVAEHVVLVAAVERAADTGDDTHAWQLAWTLGTYLDLQGHWLDQVAVQHTAIEAARRLGHRAGQYHAHQSTALAYTQLGLYDDAKDHLRHALDLSRALGNRTGQARTHLNLASVMERQRRHADALHHAQQALVLFREVGEPVWEARALNAVGWFHGLLGDYTQALDCCEQAAARYRDLGDPRGEAATWDSLGYAHHHLHHHREAVDCYRRSLALCREVGNRSGEATVHDHLGDTHRAAGDPEAARAAWQDALDILDALDHTDAERVRSKLRELDESVPNGRG